MIYLKLFEDRNWNKYYKERDDYFNDYLDKLNSGIKDRKEKEKSDHLYYSLIDSEEADELLKTIIDLTDDDITKIKKCFSKKYITKVENWDGGGTHKGIRHTKVTRTRDVMIRIWRLPDEWYLVKTGDYKERGYVYEKCDQIGGVEYLFNKITIK